MTLVFAERPAEGEPEGAFVLLHGRGANEWDLLGLFDSLDPGRRLHGFCPRGPLQLPPGGNHWYAVPRVGYPDAATFSEGYSELAAFVDALPYERIVLGGFSQGAVMSLAVGLGAGRPRPVAIVAFSGFLPVVDGWELDSARPFPPIAQAHGTLDTVIPIDLAHTTRARLTSAGAAVLYHEAPLGHAIDPAFVQQLVPWIASAVSRAPAGA